MAKYPFSERVRYMFDNTMSKGPVALIGWLAVSSLIVILAAALIVVIFSIAPEGSETPDLLEAFWMSLMRALDAGTVGGDNGWSFRLIMFIVTIGGIFILSVLIGILTTGIENKIEDLRKGRSKVLETGHTVILGWSEQVFAIVSEIAIANANQPNGCIVILSGKDKIEMEDALRDKVGATSHTRVVCRTGSPMELADLEIASIHAARSIIILSPRDDDPDSQVIKTILAITNNPNRRKDPYHIVAAICDPKNLEVAHMVGKAEVELILVSDLIARVIAQTCRQSGLSVVYTELLDFGGDEIYFKEEPLLVGKTFGEALLAYEDSAVIGVQPKGGEPQLNPPMETRLQAGDRIIAISEDDDTVELSGLMDLRINPAAIQAPRPVAPKPERTLILGWNWRAPSIINELDQYVAPNSMLTVVAEVEDGEEQIARQCAGLEHQQITFKRGDATDRWMLDSLHIETYQHVIVLCYDHLDTQKADARTLITLLHLRDMAERHGHHCAIVSEMMDLRNRQLAEVTRADDYIVSDNLISLMLAQISENKALNAVFADLFDPEGAEIYLKPASQYVKLQHEINFYTVVESARQRGQIAIGYRLAKYADDAAVAYGVVVNPDKSHLVSFGTEDRIIVLAEE